MAKPKNKSTSEPILPTKDANELQTFTAKAFEQLRPHATKIVAVLIGVVVVIAGLTVWQGMTNRKAAAATKAFSDVVAKATAPVEEAGPQIEINDLGNPEIKAGKSEIKTYAERSQQALALVAKLDSSYGSTPVARSAELVKAGLLYDAGKYDEAQAAYKAFLDTHPLAELAARAREGIGYSIEAKALAQTDAKARETGLDEAFRAFGAIDPDEKGAYHVLGLYHQARVTALKGDKKAAADLYKKAQEKQPAPELAEEISSRLSLLESAPPAAPPAPEAPKK